METQELQTRTEYLGDKSRDAIRLEAWLKTMVKRALAKYADGNKRVRHGELYDYVYRFVEQKFEQHKPDGSLQLTKTITTIVLVMGDNDSDYGLISIPFSEIVAYYKYKYLNK